MNSCSFTCANRSKRCSVEHFENHLGDVDSYAKVKALFEALMEHRPDQVKNDGFFGDWYGINSLQNVPQYYGMTGLQDSDTIGNSVVGGGTTPSELAWWNGNCRDGTRGETCVGNDYTVQNYFCAVNRSGPFPRSTIPDCSIHQTYNITGVSGWGAAGYEAWKQRINGTFKGWYE